MASVLITTIPFGDKDHLPLELLDKAGIKYLINPYKKKLTADQLCELIPEFDVVIAGTEEINEKVLNSAKNLKFISRVGIGLDSVDLTSARKLGIKVSYTPDAPAPAVAEHTLGLMLSLLRSTQLSNLHMHQGKWHRYFGRRLSNITVGIIGAGRIGSRVLNHLSGFCPARVLVNELTDDLVLDYPFKIEWASKEEIYKNADIISLHIPLTKQTRNLIDKKVLLSMQKDAMIINTSRGGIINENDLFEVMNDGHLAGAAIDVFIQEPYNGDLTRIDRCILTSHMGSMTIDCRTQMEIEATEEAIRFINGNPLQNEVPDFEYEIQRV